MNYIGNKWDNILFDEYNKSYFKEIINTLDTEYEEYIIYPKREDIFRALNLTDFDDVNIVILGQDPYHNEGEANGLAFSVNRDIKVPPSLKNIYKELNRDIGFKIPNNGDLTSWAKNGVLLLNTVLTVKKNKPNSHKNIGWQKFTDRIIQELSKRHKKMVFMLWGSNARSKKKIIDSRHLVLEAPHPSPLSCYRGYLGCEHFSLANKFLLENYNYKMDWEIKN